MLAGEAVLVEESGETVLRAGDIAAWPKGLANGHCLQNRSAEDCAMAAVAAARERCSTMKSAASFFMAISFGEGEDQRSSTTGRLTMGRRPGATGIGVPQCHSRPSAVVAKTR